MISSCFVVDFRSPADFEWRNVWLEQHKVLVLRREFRVNVCFEKEIVKHVIRSFWIGVLFVAQVGVQETSRRRVKLSWLVRRKSTPNGIDGRRKLEKYSNKLRPIRGQTKCTTKLRLIYANLLNDDNRKEDPFEFAPELQQRKVALFAIEQWHQAIYQSINDMRLRSAI